MNQHATQPNDSDISPGELVQPNRRQLLQMGAVYAGGVSSLAAPLLAGCGGGSVVPTTTAVEAIPLLFMPSAPLASATLLDYPGFKPSTTTLVAGTYAKPNADGTSSWGLRMPVDITFDRDVEVVLRDGTRMYVDIYRPAGVTTKLPTIMGWSPYGKSRPQIPAAGLRSFGIDINQLSGLQRFEGPDPAWWCAQGYAVVSPDPRGSYKSEGDILQWGPQYPLDGYDVIQWISKRDWSNGKVGLTGNSWLAISQWYIASAQPPALAAIAPWEGLVDLYRDDIGRGGLPDAQFANITLAEQFGERRTEDTRAMLAKYPLMNSHWASKIPDLSKVTVPAYVVGSWTNSLHTPGSFAGWQGIASKNKWLRVHASHEWPDYYANRDDLLKFFDFYLKGLANGWTDTPPVRLSVFDEGFTDTLNRPEATFPLARTVYKPIYLNATSARLQDTPVTSAASVAYTSDDNAGQALFTYTFTADTELTGYMALRLWLQADGASDMDVFVQVRKLAADGKATVFNNAIAASLAPTSLGPFSRHRVSLRKLDEARSTANRPYHTYDTSELLAAGQVVAVDFDLAPAGTRYRAGQTLQLSIAGFRQGPKIFRTSDEQAPRVNKGRHIVHAGGSFDSRLIIPVA